MGKWRNSRNKWQKGDKLVGDYYVKFEAEYKKQIEELIKAGQTETQAKANAEII